MTSPDRAALADERPTHIKLRPAEIQSGSDRVKWAEGLIRQLPSDHDGRNSWLLNYAGDSHTTDKVVLARSPSPYSGPDEDFKLTYIKRWRTIVKLPAKYADEIRDALALPRDAERETIEKILFKYFYNGEPGEHEAIQQAANAILALSPSPTSVMPDEGKQK